MAARRNDPTVAGGPRRLWGDRGATAVEYALLVALFIVVSLGAISFMQDKSQARLQQRAASAGNPDGAEASNTDGGTSGGTTGGGTSGGTTGGGTPIAPAGVTVASITGDKSSDPPNWIATVTIIVRDASDQVASGVTITGSWNPSVAGSTVTCVSDQNGRCIFTQKDMKQNGGGSVGSVTFTVTGMTFAGSSPAATYTLPSPPPSQTITKP